MEEEVRDLGSGQVAGAAASSLGSRVYVPVPVPPCDGRSVTVPLLFSSRKIEVRLPAPSAVKRLAVAIGPVELAPPIRNANPLFSEAAVKDIFYCANTSPENAAGKSVPRSFKRVASTI